MASSNVVAEVRKLATAALKKNHKLSGAELAPSKWAAEAGFQGSAASPLREHMARVSGNGCGRQGRYPKMTAEALLETLDLADTYKDSEGAKAQAVAKRIRAKVRPAAQAGAKKASTKRSTTRKSATKTAA